MKVRLATPADVPEIVTMGEEFVQVPGYKDRLAIDRETFGAHLSKALGSPDAAVFVLEQDGALFGAIGGLVAPSMFTPKRNAVELFWFVRPEARGNGNGRKLLDALIEWAKWHDCLSLNMIEPPDSELGRLYERLGFTKFEIYWNLPCR